MKTMLRDAGGSGGVLGVEVRTYLPGDTRSEDRAHTGPHARPRGVGRAMVSSMLVTVVGLRAEPD